MKDNLSTKLNEAFDINMLKEDEKISKAEYRKRDALWLATVDVFDLVKKATNKFNMLDGLAAETDSKARFQYENLQSDLDDLAAHMEEFCEMLKGWEK